MKRSWLFLASLAVLAMAVLGYTLVYASNATDTAEQSAVVSDEAPSKTDCPWSAKSASEKEWGSCSKKMKAACGEKKKECTTADREECRKKCESREENAEAEGSLEFN